MNITDEQLDKRVPLLSDEDLLGMAYEDEATPHTTMDAQQNVRDFYEAKIDSGELMVVRTVWFVSNDYDGNIDCDGCGWSICYIHVEDNAMTFCPGCGSKITK